MGQLEKGRALSVLSRPSLLLSDLVEIRSCEESLNIPSSLSCAFPDFLPTILVDLCCFGLTLLLLSPQRFTIKSLFSGAKTRFLLFQCSQPDTMVQFNKNLLPVAFLVRPSLSYPQPRFDSTIPSAVVGSASSGAWTADGDPWNTKNNCPAVCKQTIYSISSTYSLNCA